MAGPASSPLAYFLPLCADHHAHVNPKRLVEYLELSRITSPASSAVCSSCTRWRPRNRSDGLRSSDMCWIRADNGPDSGLKGSWKTRELLGRGAQACVFGATAVRKAKQA